MLTYTKQRLEEKKLELYYEKAYAEFLEEEGNICSLFQNTFVDNTEKILEKVVIKEELPSKS